MRKLGNWWITDQERMGSYLDLRQHVDYMHLQKDVVDFAMTKNITNAIEMHSAYNSKAVSNHRKVFVDIGASYGLVTNKVARLFDEVHCFEVLDDVRECLRLNVEEHKHCIVHGTGVSDRVRQLTVGYVPSHTMLSGVAINQEQYTDRVERVVDVAPLDDFNIVDPTCIKIDVEGHEKHVLLGARNTLMSTKVPCVVFVECWDKGEYYDKQMSDVYALMESYGYHFCGTATNVVNKKTNRTDDMIFKRGWRQIE